jgi:hypothetical protein
MFALVIFTVAQGVRRRVPTAAVRVPTAAARVKSQMRFCGIRGEQSDTGEGFLLVLWINLPVYIPPTLPHSLIILSSDSIQHGY